MGFCRYLHAALLSHCSCHCQSLPHPSNILCTFAEQKQTHRFHSSVFVLGADPQHACSRNLPACRPRSATSISDRVFICVVLADSTPTPAPRQHREQKLSMQPEMLILALSKARSSPLSALQCQRSSDAVNWLMTRTPRATASS